MNRLSNSGYQKFPSLSLTYSLQRGSVSSLGTSKITSATDPTLMLATMEEQAARSERGKSNGNTPH